MSGTTTVYLSDDSLEEHGEASNNTKFQKRILITLEAAGFTVIYERRDFTPGLSIHDSKREATRGSDIVVVVLSDRYIEIPNCMYDVALAVCFQRHIIIIDKRRTHRTMPPLLTIANVLKLNGRKSSKKILSKLIARINQYERDTNAQDQMKSKELNDKALTFVRDVEREVGIDHEQAQHSRIKELQRANARLLEEKRVFNYMSITGAEIDMKSIYSERRLRIEAEKRCRELMEKTRVMEDYFSKIQKSGNHNESINQRQQQTHEPIDQVLIQILQRIVNDVTDTSNGDRISSELRCFCQKYEKMIGPNIRRFGQLLGLTDEQIDKVEEYQKYGFTEMFWQTIRIWRPNYHGHGAFLTLLNALEGINVDIGGKPMSQDEVKVLHEKALFILNNYYNLVRLVLYLLSNHVLTDITVMYIMEPKQDEERLLRLLDVLTTKQNGIQAICDALIDTDHEFIADQILQELPNRQRYQQPVEISAESSDSAATYSSDDSKWRVAVVSPISPNRTPPSKPVMIKPCENSLQECDDSVGLIKEKQLQQSHNTKTLQSAKKIPSSCSIQ